MGSKNAEVIIIIANYNGASVFYKGKNILWHCLNSLKKTNHDNYRIVVADDSSTDDSVKFISRKFKNVDIIINKPNGGFSKNFNEAARAAIKRYNPSYIASFNSDIITTDPEWLNKMIKDLESSSNVGIVGCKLLYDDNHIQHAGMSVKYACINRGRGEIDRGQYDKRDFLKAVSGAVILIKKKVIQKVGFFDENFFMGCEDVDYCIRSHKNGFRVMYDGFVSFIHLEGQTSTRSKSENIRLKMFYFNQRNFIYLLLKHKDNFSSPQSIFSYFGTALFKMESPSQKRSAFNLQFKDRPIYRLFLSLIAIRDGINLVKRQH